jgi:hypothetical protein
MIMAVHDLRDDRQTHDDHRIFTLRLKLKTVKVSSMLRLPELKTFGTWRWYGCQPYTPAAFTPRKYRLILATIMEYTVLGPATAQALFARNALWKRDSSVGFVVDKVAMGQVFLRVLRFPPVIIIPPILHIHP